MVELVRRGVTLRPVAALIDGVEVGIDAVVLTVRDEGDATRIDLTVVETGRPLAALGLRFAVSGACRYLRNGYQSWDGSWFERPGTPAGDGPPAKAPKLGFAMTALLPDAGGGAVVLGADRHDRFQTRFGFGGDGAATTLTVETLLDGTGATAMEPLFLFDGDAVEDSLRRWSRRVAAASPLPPRTGGERITGWCSWYNHYAAIDEATIRRELAGARAFRDTNDVPLKVFQVDDGFTPEMGDWLDVKPQFPRGMAPILSEVAAAGFVPGLWIAPFLVGNRSKLFAEHPDWMVRDVAGGPLLAFSFYGEFRWHKRSEEYHVLDVTHPEAAAHIAEVFRTWVRDWGARYLKCDFLLHGAEYGPERAVWHEAGLSRIAVWRRMMTIIRESVGEDVLIEGCGCPLWASVGLVDAVRIGRDVGVAWHGDYSAESLLRDLQTRNHAHGVLWRADPDCLLLRERFHAMSDGEIEALARFAGGAGGVLMTSDTLAELPPARAALFADLLRQGATGCDFPELGGEGAVVQRVRRGGAVIATHRFNPGDDERDGIPPHMLMAG